MPDRNRTAVDVHLLLVETELAHDDEALRGKRFVQLDQVDIPDLDAGAFEQLAHRGDRADAHDTWIHAGDRAAGKAPERLDAELRGLLLRCDDDGCGAVVDAARVAGRDRAALAEGRLQ